MSFGEGEMKRLRKEWPEHIKMSQIYKVTRSQAAQIVKSPGRAYGGRRLLLRQNFNHQKNSSFIFAILDFFSSYIKPPIE